MISKKATSCNFPKVKLKVLILLAMTIKLINKICDFPKVKLKVFNPFRLANKIINKT